MQIPDTLAGLTDKGLTRVIVLTYGTLHGNPPAPTGSRSDLVEVDLSEQLRNPADTRLREMTGLDREVRQHVMATPGATKIVDDTIARIGGALIKMQQSGRQELTEVHVRCRGGRHRSVVIAEEVAVALRAQGVNAEVEHHHIDKPLI